LLQAIDRTRASGGLERLARAVGWPGYRRELTDRFASWTRLERSSEGFAPDRPAAAEEGRIFAEYRATLEAIGGEDPEGFAAWASRALDEPMIQRLGAWKLVVVIDPIAPSPAQWRAISALMRKPRAMLATLPHDGNPALAETYVATAATRQRFLDARFHEEPAIAGDFEGRPSGLVAVESELFRNDVHSRPSWGPLDGLKVLGGPRGEGVALLVAREVHQALTRGCSPEEILILVPRLDEDAERIRETLGAWGLPVSPAPGRRLSTIPAISALRRAIRIPIENWETSGLIRLLRNGQLARFFADETNPNRRFAAASAIRSTRVFRDRPNLERALARVTYEEKSTDPHANPTATLERLAAWLDPISQPGTWSELVQRLQALSAALMIDAEALPPLWDALEDHADVLERIGAEVSRSLLTWSQFVAEVDAIAAEISEPDPEPDPDAVMLTTVASAGGARARIIILANLAEKTFPAEDAIDLDAPGPAASLAYAREQLRFAGVAGATNERLVLAYPVTDLDGSPLLPAGFLEELLGRLDAKASETLVERHARFEPTLASYPQLARAPVDERVRAVALACQRQGDAELRRIAGSPAHRAPLLAVADAFEVAQGRRGSKIFGPHDGRLADPRGIAEIAARFGPSHSYSASQLESLALCPYQFFLRYVLGLRPVDERREIDEDRAARGSEIHRKLEKIHTLIALDPATPLFDRLEVLVTNEVRVALEATEPPPPIPADVASVLEEITNRRSARMLEKYLRQVETDLVRRQSNARPYRFELEFGTEDADEPRSLVLGSGEHAIRLQGKIDRIDRVADPAGDRFRVVDYKTGGKPTNLDVNDGLASQLPLYAMAVEQLGLAGDTRLFADAGYWHLPKNGYQSVKIKDWADFRSRLETFLLELVAELRRGVFVIHPRKKDCHQACDFASVCRIAEVRAVQKGWDGMPRIEEARS
jgi:RecB family exonuclease